MAPRRSKAQKSALDELPADFEGNVVDIDVTREMEDSFLEYSYSVIYSRALPDARDGLTVSYTHLTLPTKRIV